MGEVLDFRLEGRVSYSRCESWFVHFLCIEGMEGNVFTESLTELERGLT